MMHCLVLYCMLCKMYEILLLHVPGLTIVHDVTFYFILLCRRAFNPVLFFLYCYVVFRSD